MYNKGELLQYGNNGVCKIEDIVWGMAGGYDKDTQYYLMVPISNINNTIYLPVNNDKAKVRPVLSATEITDILNSVDDMKEYVIVNEKQCEVVYKEAIYSLDCTHWFELLKTLCMRKTSRALQGKKITSTDERYLKNVSQRLQEELTVALGEEKAICEMNSIIENFENCVII
ncbi:MAG: hypothetical protein MJ124_05385 [Lachnospiraceae bacterium]|nr:hypothetical protein [Lachnospiraceae bacterium]